jgi:perosamine synthetase
LLDGNEKKYLLECIESGWVSSEGPFVERFEKEFAKRHGRKHGVAVSNGTAAIDLAVDSIGIGPGDEVILPSFTIISCILQIVRSGATPVLIDSDPITWNMNVNHIEERVTKKTKAILVVHIYGLPTDMDPIIDIANRYGLKIIEDAAEMHGQTYKSMPCGSFGDLSTFSFYPNKHVTTGEGGMVLTDDDVLAETCRSLRNLCFQSGKRFIHERLGWNLRMTNLQAALGLAQLERLDEFVHRKRVMGSIYTQHLQGVPGLQLPLKSTDYADNIYWVYGVLLEKSTGLTVASVMEQLATMGVGTRPFFYPMHLQPALKKIGCFSGCEKNYPIAEDLYERGFYLPSGIALSCEQIESSAKALREIMI